MDRENEQQEESQAQLKVPHAPDTAEQVEEDYLEYNISLMDASQSYPLKRFDCGNDVLNKYFQGSLKKAVEQSNTTATVAFDTQGNVLGICTFSPYALGKARLANALQGSLPKDVGCIRLIMLGVQTAYQANGVGSELMKDFFERAVGVHQRIKVRGIYLDSHPNSVEFYLKLGFIQLEEVPEGADVPMFIRIETVIESMHQAAQPAPGH